MLRCGTFMKNSVDLYWYLQVDSNIDSFSDQREVQSTHELKSWVCGAAVVANEDDLIDEVDPDATIRPSRRKDHLPHQFNQSDHTKT
jgi:hypothetical protein